MRNSQKKLKKEELIGVMKSFKKDISPCPNGQTIDLFLAFFDLLRDDNLEMDEELKEQEKMPGNLNSTFLALIPKLDYVVTFGDFR